MEELKSNEETVVKLAAMITAAGKPGADGGLTDAEYIFEGGSINAQGEKMKYDADDLGLCFQAIERSVASYCEFFIAGLAAQILDFFTGAVRAIADERMDSIIGYVEIGAGWIGAKVTLSGDRFLFSAFACALHPRNGRNMRELRRLGFTLGKGCLAIGAVLLALWLIDQGFGG